MRALPGPWRATQRSTQVTDRVTVIGGFVCELRARFCTMPQRETLLKESHAACP